MPKSNTQEKEILITASIGIMTDNEGNHILQIITADGYNFYNVQMTAEQARQLSDKDNIEIDLDREPAEGYLLGGNIH